MAGPQGSLAGSVFTTGASDVVPVVDVYSSPEATPTNAQPATTPSSINDLAAATSKSKPNTIITPTPGVTAAQTAAGATDKVKSVAGVTAGDVSDLGTKLKNAVLTAAGLAAIGSALPSAFQTGGVPAVLAIAGPVLSEVPGVKMIYDTVSSVVDSANLETAQGISTFMNTFASANISSVFDLKSKFAVMGTLLHSATGLGLPSILTDIVNQFDASDIPNFLSAQVLTAIENAELNVLALIIQHVPSHVILALVPRAIPMLLSAYSLPKGTIYATTGTKSALLNILTAIDPNWMYYNRNGHQITNLEPFNIASSDALKVLSVPLSSPASSADKALLEACNIARAYGPRLFADISTECFPGAAIAPPETSVRPRASLGLPQLSLPNVPGIPKLQFNF